MRLLASWQRAQRSKPAAGATNKWRASKDARGVAAPRLGGRIGPNAILQMLPVLDRICGRVRRDELVRKAGLNTLPDGRSMITESQATRLHRQVRSDERGLAKAICTASGVGTAEYIMAHRIPKMAQWLLKRLPAAMAARLLSKAIAKHAWTFVGSGKFTVVSPWVFEISGNPLIHSETSDVPLCHWHVSVFETLYQSLVSRRCTCTETDCSAIQGSTVCRFEITRTKTA